MNKTFFVSFLSFVLLTSSVVAQQSGTARIGGFDLDWRKGTFLLTGPTPTGKASVKLVGESGPVVFIRQETGGEALKRAKRKSRRSDIRGHNLVIAVVNYGVKGKNVAVSGATFTQDVTILMEEVTLEGEKTTLKIRCDEAVFKAGPKLGTGRIDFSGDVHVWSYGGELLSDGELTAKGGWIDLGDPDDPENNPRRLFLGAGNMTGNPKPTEGKKKL